MALFTRRRTPDTDTQPETPNTALWPDNVIARYLTLVGATVDLTGEDVNVSLCCTGCAYSGSHWGEENAREHAQRHAEKCRALPRPDQNGERRHQLAMAAAHELISTSLKNTKINGPWRRPEAADLRAVVYGNHQIRLTEAEATEYLDADFVARGFLRTDQVA